MTNSKTLILGGVRSGKSRLAERLAAQGGRSVVYIATATSEDQEMRRRIAAHRARRPTDWQLVEEPRRLGSALVAHAGPERCVLVDCLTLWLTNLLTDDDNALLERERMALLEVLPGLAGQIILVSNETNMGVTPMGELSRRYCDLAGMLHQALGQCCDRVILMVAGLPSVLKGAPI